MELKSISSSNIPRSEKRKKKNCQMMQPNQITDVLYHEFCGHKYVLADIKLKQKNILYIILYLDMTYTDLFIRHEYKKEYICITCRWWRILSCEYVIVRLSMYKKKILFD